MPLGDPMGGDAPDTDRGSLLYIDAVTVPVSNIDEALKFYAGILGLTVAEGSRTEDRVELVLPEGGARIILYLPPSGGEVPGIKTGIILATDSIYDFHKVMVDEGVDFTLKPKRDEYGRLIVRILDGDRNEIEIIDHPPAHPVPRSKATAESMAGGKCPVRRKK